MSLSVSRENDIGAPESGDASGYLDTIAMLQEELARLEQELRDRVPSGSSAVADPDPDAEDARADAEATARARLEVDRLETELAVRDETIALLMDHLGRVEEGQAASRAEWEQLSWWLAELERRVEERGADVSPALEDRRPAIEVGLAGAIDERDALRRQLEIAQDDRRREQHEHASTVAEFQTRLAGAALAVAVATPEPAHEVETISRARDEQLRFRALREHLLEIHRHEQEERKQKQLIPRLSRLWSRTGPR